MASKNSKEPLESYITAKILKRLRERGGYWVKTHGSPYTANQPDIIGVYQGRYVALEVKRPSRSDKVTPGQASILASIRNAGGIGLIVTSVDEAMYVIDRLDMAKYPLA